MAELRGILIMVVLIAMVSLGMAGFIGDQAQVQNVNDVNVTFLDPFSASLGNMSNTTETLRKNMQSADPSIKDGFTALFGSSFIVLKIVLSVVFLPINIMIALGGLLGLPWWFATGITAIIIITVVFVIANVIFGRGAT